MGDWYAIGITVGLGVAAGVFLAGLLAGRRGAFVASMLGAVVIGVATGALIEGWIGLPGAVVGAVVGTASASVVVRGAMRRGATPGGTALLVGAVALVIAAVSLIPIVGYVVAVAVPGLAARRARQHPETYAGLRTLAK